MNLIKLSAMFTCVLFVGVASAQSSATERGMRFVDLKQTDLDVLQWKNSGAVDYSGFIQNGKFLGGMRPVESEPYCLVRPLDYSSSGDNLKLVESYVIQSISNSFSTLQSDGKWFTQITLGPKDIRAVAPMLLLYCWGPSPSGLEEMTIREFEALFGEFITFNTLTVKSRPRRPETWPGSQLTPDRLLKSIELHVRADLSSSSDYLYIQNGQLLPEDAIVGSNSPFCFLANRTKQKFTLKSGTVLKIKSVGVSYSLNRSDAEVGSKPEWNLELINEEDPSLDLAILCENSSLRDPPDYPELQNTTSGLISWVYR